MRQRNEVSIDGRPFRASRAPVIVAIGGLALAVGLVLLGARMAAAPVAAPPIERPGMADAPRPVNVIMRDYVFNPSTIRLVPGETVRFELINGGLVEHEFVLGDDATQAAWAEAHRLATPPAPLATAPPASVPPDVAGVRVLLSPGRSSSVTYEVPATTRLAFLCHLPGHLERGMSGTVELVDR